MLKELILPIIKDLLHSLHFPLVPCARGDFTVDARANSDVCGNSRRAMSVDSLVTFVYCIADIGPWPFCKRIISASA